MEKFSRYHRSAQSIGKNETDLLGCWASVRSMWRNRKKMFDDFTVWIIEVQAPPKTCYSYPFPNGFDHMPHTHTGTSHACARTDMVKAYTLTQVYWCIVKGNCSPCVNTSFVSFALSLSPPDLNGSLVCRNYRAPCTVSYIVICICPFTYRSQQCELRF